MEKTMSKVGFVEIKESDYEKLKENGELDPGVFYHVIKDNEENESAGRQYYYKAGYRRSF